jgi:hypothetical protein
MSRTAALVRLVRVGEALVRGDAPPQAEAAELGAGLLRFAAGGCGDLHQALGMGVGPGHHRPGAQAAMMRRDLAVVEAVELFRRQGVDNPAAALATALRRYRDSSWHIDRDKSAPLRPVAAACWKILKAKPVAIGARRIGMIVSDRSPGGFVSPKTCNGTSTQEDTT